MTDDVRNYRRAAEVALEQLDWLIGYLYRVRKYEVASALSRNRDQIRRTLSAAEERGASGPGDNS